MWSLKSLPSSIRSSLGSWEEGIMIQMCWSYLLLTTLSMYWEADWSLDGGGRCSGVHNRSDYVQYSSFLPQKQNYTVSSFTSALTTNPGIITLLPGLLLRCVRVCERACVCVHVAVCKSNRSCRASVSTSRVLIRHPPCHIHTHSATTPYCTLWSSVSACTHTLMQPATYTRVRTYALLPIPHKHTHSHIHTRTHRPGPVG